MARHNRFTDLFATDEPARVNLAMGAVLSRGLALNDAAEIVGASASTIASAPFRHFVTPGGRTRLRIACLNTALAKSLKLRWNIRRVERL
jgi:hypothetical protein